MTTLRPEGPGATAIYKKYMYVFATKTEHSDPGGPFANME